MLYHPLFAAIIPSDIFLRVSIKRVLLEYEIPPFSNTRRKWLILAAIGGEVTRGRFISHNSSMQGRSNLFFLPFLLTVSTQTVFQRTWTVKLFQSFNISLLNSTIQRTQRPVAAYCNRSHCHPCWWWMDIMVKKSVFTVPTGSFELNFCSKAGDTFLMEALTCSWSMIWTVMVFPRYPSTCCSFSSSSSDRPRYEPRLSLSLRRNMAGS